MKQVTMFKTLDGVAHPSHEAAKRQAEERYGRQLTMLAQRALKHDKYMAMIDFIEQSLGDFQLLATLKADIELQPPEEE